jgi:aromatic ring-cleaving dioxygenase
MSTYHAHLYFHEQEEAAVRAILRELVDPVLHLERVYPNPVGPHPLAMVEFHFAGEHKSVVLSRLKAMRLPYSVLIHEETGDDHRDHAVGIHWIGPPLPIDFSFFDRVREDPSLAIHPRTRPLEERLRSRVPSDAAQTPNPR